MEKPAGFWIRFLAYFIDGIIVSVPSYIILFVINSVFVAGAVATNPYMTEEEYLVKYMNADHDRHQCVILRAAHSF